MTLWKLSRLCVLTLLFSVFLFPGLSFAEVNIGDDAPAFSLIDENGKEVRLADFSGKTVVLEWVNPDCPFVKRHYQKGTMQNLANEFSDKEVVWLAINSTHYMDRDENKAFADKFELSFPVLNDAAGAVGQAYGAKTTPHIFVVNGEGKVVYAGGIDDDSYGDKPADERQQYVQKALSALVEGKEPDPASTKPYGCSVKYKS